MIGKKTIRQRLTSRRKAHGDRRRGALRRVLRGDAVRSLRLESLEDRRLLAVFANSDPITINHVGPATPYPAAISVSGLAGPVVDVNVSIDGLGHTLPAEVELLLVGPSGSSTLLMNESGAGFDISNVDLTFDDAAAAGLPTAAMITSGSYRPTPAGGVSLTSPAGPYGTTLATHNGATANGTWNLYAFDRTAGDAGIIAGGWSLEITTLDPDPVVSGDALDNDIQVRLKLGDPTQLEVQVDGGAPISYPVAQLTSLTLNGGDGDDTFTIDHGNGVVTLPITVNGQGQATATGDQLVITGPAVDTVVHTFDNANDGSVEIDVAGGGTDATVSYTGLEPVIDNLDAANRVFTFTGGAELITLGDDAVAANNASQIDSSLGESVTFTNPTASLAVNAGTGGDIIVLNAMDSLYAASLAINADAGGDVINVRATTAGTATTINGGDENDVINVSSDAPGLLGNLNGIAGALVINGDGGDDILNVSDLGGGADAAGTLSGTQISGLGNAGSIIYAVETLSLDLSKGPDTLLVTGTHAGTTAIDGNDGADTFNVRATTGATTINAGDHNDTFNVSSDAPANLGNLNGIAGTLTINGEGGANDVLNVSDLGGAADAAATLTATQISGLGNAAAITYAVDTLNLDLSKGSDTLTIVGTHAGATTIDGNAGLDTFNIRATAGATTINGGDNADTFNVSSDAPANAGNVNGIAAALVLSGDAGDDVVRVSDLGGAADAAGILSATQISGLGNAGTITYGSIAELTIDLSGGADTLTVTGTHGGLTRINGNGGGDTINVAATAAGSTTNINGGDGGDTVTVGSTGSLANVLGTVAFGGDAPAAAPGDTLIINDAGNAAAASYSIQPTAVTKAGTTTLVGYSAVEALTLNTGSNVDQIVVAAAAGIATTVNAGDGADQIVLTSTGAGSTVQLNGQLGNDVINVRSTAAGSTTTVSGGDGDDVINVSSDAPANLGNLNGIAGALTINGDGGVNDVLNVSDLGGAADAAATLTAAQISGLGNAAAITYAVDTLNLDLSKGSDTLTIVGTHAGATTIDGNEGLDTFNIRATAGVTTINGGDNVDTFNVSSDAPANAGNVNGIAAALVLNGDTGDDVVRVSDLGGAADAAGTLSATQISGLGNAGAITYGSIAELTIDLSGGADTLTVTGTQAALTRINGNGGGDTINVAATAAGTTTNINGGDGGDTVTVGSTGSLANVLGTVAFGGGPPATAPGDTLIVNDAGNNDSDAYEISLIGVRKTIGPGGAVLLDIGYSGVETLTLNTGSQQDVITVTAGAGIAVTVNAGDGSDSISLLSTGAGAVVQLNGQGGDDTLAVAATHATSTVQLNGGAGNDGFHVGASFSVLDTILGLVTVDGGPSGPGDSVGGVPRSETVAARRSPTGSPLAVSVSQTVQVHDRLFLRDNNSAAADLYTVSDGQIRRDRDDVRVDFTAVELVDLRTGTGGDAVTIADTPDAIVLNLGMTGGFGQTDTVTIQDTGTGSITEILTGNGTDDVQIQSTGASSILQVNTEASADAVSLQGLGSGSGVEIVGGSGADLITLGTAGVDPAPLASPAAVVVEGGLDGDQFEILHLLRSAAFDLRGQQGNDTFNLRPAAATSDGALVGLTDDTAGTIRELLIDGGANGAQPVPPRRIVQGAVVRTVDGGSTRTGLPYDITSSLAANTVEDPVEVGDTVNLFAGSVTAALDLRFHIVGQGDSVLGTARPGQRLDPPTPTTLQELSENRDIETVNLLTGSGDDTLTVTSDIPINAAGGSDAVLTFDAGSGGEDLMQIRGTAAGDQITIGPLQIVPPSDRYPFEVASVEFLRVDAEGGNDEVVNHTAATSVVNGGAGDDVLSGGSGDDLLAGGAGVDALFGSNGNDVVLSDQDHDETSPDPSDVADGDLLDGGSQDPARDPRGDGFIQQGADFVRNFEFGALQGAELDVKTWLQGTFLPAAEVLEFAQLERFGRALEAIPGPPVTPDTGSIFTVTLAEGEASPALPSADADHHGAVDRALADWDAADIAFNRLGLNL